MRKIEHIGIAVQDIEASNKVFTKIFGKDSYKSERVESEGVITSFFQIGESKIELVSATNSESPISKYLQKNREGMHHIALIVDDIEVALIFLKERNVNLVDSKPRIGAEGYKIAFIHPGSSGGVLIELCQKEE